MSSTESTAANTQWCARLYSCETRSVSWLYSQPDLSPCIGRQNPDTQSILALCLRFRPTSTLSWRDAFAFSCTHTAPVMQPITFGLIPSFRANSPLLMYL